MNKAFLIFLLIGQTLFYSCNTNHDKVTFCYNNYKKARDLAYNNPYKPASLDSALIIVNKCMQCDSIKPAIIDLKLRLLITLNKLREGSEFINSLPPSDFTYAYQKSLYQDGLIARNFESIKDTINRDKVYKRMAVDLCSYIANKNLESKEFHEAFTELSAIPRNSIDSISLIHFIDSLKIKYPNEERFLDFYQH